MALVTPSKQARADSLYDAAGNLLSSGAKSLALVGNTIGKTAAIGADFARRGGASLIGAELDNPNLYTDRSQLAFEANAKGASDDLSSAQGNLRTLFGAKAAPAVVAPVAASTTRLPRQPAPVQPAPVQTAPVQTAPVQPELVQTAPAQPDTRYDADVLAASGSSSRTGVSPVQYSLPRIASPTGEQPYSAVSQLRNLQGIDPSRYGTGETPQDLGDMPIGQLMGWGVANKAKVKALAEANSNARVSDTNMVASRGQDLNFKSSIYGNDVSREGHYLTSNAATEGNRLQHAAANKISVDQVKAGLILRIANPKSPEDAKEAEALLERLSDMGQTSATMATDENGNMIPYFEKGRHAGLIAGAESYLPKGK